MGSVEPTDFKSREFARVTWEQLRDGGVWAVPRSGLMYRKDEAAKQMVLIMRMPWFDGLSVTPEDLRGRQSWDHQGIIDMFDAIGIEVREEKG